MPKQGLAGLLIKVVAVLAAEAHGIDSPFRDSGGGVVVGDEVAVGVVGAGVEGVRAVRDGRVPLDEVAFWVVSEAVVLRAERGREGAAGRVVARDPAGGAVAVHRLDRARRVQL